MNDSPPSVARHLALVGCVLLCVVFYAGWRLRHPGAPSGQDTRLVAASPDRPAERPERAARPKREEKDENPGLGVRSERQRVEPKAEKIDPPPPPEPERKPRPETTRKPPRETDRFFDYTVEPGDTLGRIAARLLGSAAREDEILAANKTTLPDRHKLQAGQRLRIPGSPPAGARSTEKPDAKAPREDSDAPPPREARKRTVKPGETLSGIAREEYGSPAAWKRIFEANRRVLASPDRLPAGVTLTLPADAPTATRPETP